MEKSHLKQYTQLWKGGLRVFFVLLLIDFIFYKIFGETHNDKDSLGWYLFVGTSFLCALSFALFLVAFVCEFITANTKEPRTFPMKLFIWFFVSLLFIIAHTILLGGHTNLYPVWARISFSIGFLAMIGIMFLFTAKLILYLVALANVEKNE
jgi:hypothetical protein